MSVANNLAIKRETRNDLIPLALHSQGKVHITNYLDFVVWMLDATKTLLLSLYSLFVFVRPLLDLDFEMRYKQINNPHDGSLHKR